MPRIPISQQTRLTQGTQGGLAVPRGFGAGGAALARATAGLGDTFAKIKLQKRNEGDQAIVLDSTVGLSDLTAFTKAESKKRTLGAAVGSAEELMEDWRKGSDKIVNSMNPRQQQMFAPRLAQGRMMVAESLNTHESEQASLANDQALANRLETGARDVALAADAGNIEQYRHLIDQTKADMSEFMQIRNMEKEDRERAVGDWESGAIRGAVELMSVRNIGDAVDLFEDQKHLLNRKDRLALDQALKNPSQLHKEKAALVTGLDSLDKMTGEDGVTLAWDGRTDFTADQIHAMDEYIRTLPEEMQENVAADWEARQTDVREVNAVARNEKAVDMSRRLVDSKGDMGVLGAEDWKVIREDPAILRSLVEQRAVIRSAHQPTPEEGWRILLDEVPGIMTGKITPQDMRDRLKTIASLNGRITTAQLNHLNGLYDDATSATSKVPVPVSFPTMVSEQVKLADPDEEVLTNESIVRATQKARDRANRDGVFTDEGQNKIVVEEVDKEVIRMGAEVIREGRMFHGGLGAHDKKKLLTDWTDEELSNWNYPSKPGDREFRVAWESIPVPHQEDLKEWVRNIHPPGGGPYSGSVEKDIIGELYFEYIHERGRWEQLQSHFNERRHRELTGRAATRIPLDKALAYTSKWDNATEEEREEAILGLRDEMLRRRGFETLDQASPEDQARAEKDARDHQRRQLAAMDDLIKQQQERETREKPGDEEGKTSNPISATFPVAVKMF